MSCQNGTTLGSVHRCICRVQYSSRGAFSLGDSGEYATGKNAGNTGSVESGCLVEGIQETCVSGTLHTEGQDPPKSFLSFAVPKFTNTYEVR